MFDQFYGDINGQNIYDLDSTDQEDYYSPEELNPNIRERNVLTNIIDDNHFMKEEKPEAPPKILTGEIKRESNPF